MLVNKFVLTGSRKALSFSCMRRTNENSYQNCKSMRRDKLWDHTSQNLLHSRQTVQTRTRAFCKHLCHWPFISRQHQGGLMTKVPHSEPCAEDILHMLVDNIIGPVFTNIWRLPTIRMRKRKQRLQPSTAVNILKKRYMETKATEPCMHLQILPTPCTSSWLADDVQGTHLGKRR